MRLLQGTGHRGLLSSGRPQVAGLSCVLPGSLSILRERHPDVPSTLHILVLP